MQGCFRRVPNGLRVRPVFISGVELFVDGGSAQV